MVSKYPEDFHEPFLEVPSGWRIAEGDADDLRVCATHPWQVRLILRVVFAPEFDLFLFCRSRSTRWCQARTLVFSDGQAAGTLLYFNPKQRGNCSPAVRSIVQYFDASFSSSGVKHGKGNLSKRAQDHGVTQYQASSEYCAILLRKAAPSSDPSPSAASPQPSAPPLDADDVQGFHTAGLL